MKTRKMWLGFIAVMTISFAVLLYYGREIYREAPPIPDKVVASDGAVLFSAQDIKDGQNVWQSTGGMQIGSIWGHGAYQAPDWTADWLHRELLAWLELAAQEDFGVPYSTLEDQDQAGLHYALQQEYRANTYDSNTGVLTLSERRALAIAQTADYYHRLYGDAPELQSTRQSFAMKENTLP